MADGTLKVGTITTSSGSGTITTWINLGRQLLQYANGTYFK